MTGRATKNLQIRPRARRGLAAACIFAGLACASMPAKAQFRNNAFEVQLGLMGLGTSTDFLNSAYGQKWGATDQLSLGMGYTRWVGAGLWTETQTVLGFGTAATNDPFPRTVIGLNISQGLRWVFLDEEHRPFVSGHIHYLQLFNIEGTAVQGSPVLGGQALWVGGRVGGGYEWFFLEEISVGGEGSGVVFVGLDQPPKVSWLARGYINIYF